MPQRKHPAHGVHETEGAPTIVYLTVCTKNRSPWLACDDVHQLLHKVWCKATAWLMGRYMIMPDHIHCFAGWTGSPIDLDGWVQYWKSQFSKGHQNKAHRWQEDHWDTRMRTVEKYEQKWVYVRNNSVRHGLVDDPDDWPYHGEIHRLMWE